MSTSVDRTDEIAHREKEWKATIARNKREPKSTGESGREDGPRTLYVCVVDAEKGSAHLI